MSTIALQFKIELFKQSVNLTGLMVLWERNITNFCSIERFFAVIRFFAAISTETLHQVLLKRNSHNVSLWIPHHILYDRDFKHLELHDHKN